MRSTAPLQREAADAPDQFAAYCRTSVHIPRAAPFADLSCPQQLATRLVPGGRLAIAPDMRILAFDRSGPRARRLQAATKSPKPLRAPLGPSGITVGGRRCFSGALAVPALLGPAGLPWPVALLGRRGLPTVVIAEELTDEEPHQEPHEPR